MDGWIDKQIDGGVPDSLKQARGMEEGRGPLNAIKYYSLFLSQLLGTESTA